jgi:hypothetical protein
MRYKWQHAASNNGHTDAAVARYDANGVLQWQKVWSSGPAYNTWPQAVIATSDGGFAVAGTLEGNIAQGLFVMKFDAQDNLQWTKSYMPASGVVHLGTDAIVQLADGGFALQARNSTFGGWCMLRTDPAGAVIWSDRFEPYADALDVAELPNGDLVFMGWGSSLGGTVLRKDGMTGVTEWMHDLGSDPAHDVDPFSVVVGPDSTIVLGGQCEALDGSANTAAFAMAISAGGTPQWMSIFNTADLDFGRDIAVDPNGGYVLCGYMVEEGTAIDVASFVAKLDGNGQPIWSKRFDHSDQGTVRFLHASVTSDGGALLSGYFGTPDSYPAMVVKLDADGNSCPYCPTAPVGEWASPAPVTLPDGVFQAFGTWATEADHVFTETEITASAVAEVCGTVGVHDEERTTQVMLAPDPFNASTVLTLELPLTRNTAVLILRDVTGRNVHEQRVRSGSNLIERGGLCAGSYTWSISDALGAIAKGKLQVND